MHTAANHTEGVLQLVRKNGRLRASDLADAGVPRVVLTRITASGQLERTARGLYRLPGASSSEHEGLVAAARTAPQAVIRLLSALQLQGLTAQLLWHVWIAMPRGSHVPRLGYPPIKMVRFTGAAYTHGIEGHERDGVKLLVNSRLKNDLVLVIMVECEALDGPTLGLAISVTFQRCDTAVPADLPVGLSDEFAGDATRMALWQSLLKRCAIAYRPLVDDVTVLRSISWPVLHRAKPRQP